MDRRSKEANVVCVWEPPRLPYHPVWQGADFSCTAVVCLCLHHPVFCFFLLSSTRNASCAGCVEPDLGPDVAQRVCPAWPGWSAADLALCRAGGMIEGLWNFSAACLNRCVKTLPSAPARSSLMSLRAQSWTRFAETWPANTKAWPWSPLQPQPTQMHMHPEHVCPVTHFPTSPHLPACWIVLALAEVASLFLSCCFPPVLLQV